jgi:hypothetical protein
MKTQYQEVANLHIEEKAGTAPPKIVEALNK